MPARKFNTPRFGTGPQTVLGIGASFFRVPLWGVATVQDTLENTPARVHC